MTLEESQAKVAQLEARIKELETPKPAPPAPAPAAAPVQIPRPGPTLRQIEVLQEQLDAARKEVAELKKAPAASRGTLRERK